ncbi:ImmA/IrrE family metallo-endopeptidase [Thiohalocapsa marina]|uniref:ImmA/IrrE family metallo-endopeptidase n=1 Tax=Thiohalocapsa marina TaxID=424902 RepID=UPI0036DEA789
MTTLAPSTQQGELDLTAGSADVERSLLADLIERSQLYRESPAYLELLQFVSRLRNFAPFNAMLLHVQKPDLQYAASADDWQTRFNRRIKPGARPLVILWPFAPVAFVYDVVDTEGDDLPVDVAEVFHATGDVTTERMLRFGTLTGRHGIHLKFNEGSALSAGWIQAVRQSKKKKQIPDYRVFVNNLHKPPAQFVTLAHELGHLYLGHLGPDKHLGIETRRPLSKAEKELEAESLAYLVSARQGIQSRSESYLEHYVTKATTIESIDLDLMLKAAGQVEALLGIAGKTLFAPKRTRLKKTPRR